VHRSYLHHSLADLAHGIERTFSSSLPLGESIDLREFISSGAITNWLSSFIDVVYERWKEQPHVRVGPTNQLDDETVGHNGRIYFCSMESLSVDLQSRQMDNQLARDICFYKELYSLQEFKFQPSGQQSAFDGMSSTKMSNTRGSQSRHTIRVSRTYLTKYAEIVLGVSLGTFPMRWREPRIVNPSISIECRSRLSFCPELSDPGTLEHFIRSYLPLYLPMSLVENFDEIQRAVKDRVKKVPDAFFTAHLHLASDSFLIWAVMQRKKGMKLILSQHGGLYGQGLVPTRGAEFEQEFADHYLHWGWADSPNATKIPSQLNVWAKRRKRSNQLKQMLMITDCTFRFSRRPWPNTTENIRYKQMLLEAYEALDEDVRKQTVVRLHHDHDKYDESHEKMWLERFPNATVNDGLSSIWKLRRRARLIVCTSLGTSEIEQFGRNMPTILRLDPEVHALRPSCVELFGEMERVGLVHWTTESFSQFVHDHWSDIDGWWGSPETQKVVTKYMATFGHRSERPLRDLRRTLLDLTRDAE
jgi:putative transferase (TIGR04331 family)